MYVRLITVLWLDGSRIVDKAPAATLISTKKRIHDHCVHCTGFNFYQSFILVKVCLCIFFCMCGPFESQ